MAFRALRRAGALLALALACGCHTTDKAPDPVVKPPESSVVKSPPPDVPPKGVPCKVVAAWQPKVSFEPDPGRGGAPGPVLVGRLYLWSEEERHTLEAEGSLIVDLYDLTSGAEVMLEEWRIDPVTLKRLLRRDIIGWGYTVGLPWTTYKPEVSKVVLKLRFDPKNGSPLHYLGEPMALSNGGGLPTVIQAGKRN